MYLFTFKYRCFKILSLDATKFVCCVFGPLTLKLSTNTRSPRILDLAVVMDAGRANTNIYPKFHNQGL